MTSGPINSRAIVVVGITLLGLFGAVAAGNAVATGQLRLILFASAASFAMIIGFSLGKNFWMLVPLTVAASGSVGALGLPFSYAEMGVIGACGLFVIHVCLKKAHLGFRPGVGDLCVFLNAAYLVTLFARNPIGLQSFGADMVGGRAYVGLLFSFLGYLMLSHARLPARWAPLFPAVMAFFMLLPASLVAASDIFPPISKVIYPFYSGVNIQTFQYGQESVSVARSELRVTGFQEVARPIILALCAYFPPVTLINPIFPGRFFLFFFAMVLAGLSGFRSLILAIGGYMVAATLVRRRYADLIVLSAVGVIAVVLVLIAQLGGIAVPTSIQRSLAFLPLEWDPAAIESAEGTKTWRVDMWFDAWNDPHVIKNKLLGDGFGFSMEEMRIFGDELLGIGGFQGTDNTYESFLIRGSFHNGPLSAIRFGGIVGLALVTLLMAAIFHYAIRTIVRARGTPYFVLAVFVSLGVLYQPFEFFIIFGAYDNALSLSFFTLGMLNLVNFSLTNWLSAQKTGEKKSGDQNPAGVPPQEMENGA